VPAVSVYPDSDKIGVFRATRLTSSSLSARARCRGPTARRAGTGRT